MHDLGVYHTCIGRREETGKTRGATGHCGRAETSNGKIRLQTKRASVMEGRVVVIGGSFDPELSAHVGGDDRHYHVP